MKNKSKGESLDSPVTDPAARRQSRVRAGFGVGAEMGKQLGAAQNVETAGNINRNTINRHNIPPRGDTLFVVRPSQCLYDTTWKKICQYGNLDVPRLKRFSDYFRKPFSFFQKKSSFSRRFLEISASHLYANQITKTIAKRHKTAQDAGLSIKSNSFFIFLIKLYHKFLQLANLEKRSFSCHYQLCSCQFSTKPKSGHHTMRFLGRSKTAICR